MKRTFHALATYMQKHLAIETVPGRDVKYSIPNVTAIGIDALLTSKGTGGMPNQENKDVGADADEAGTAGDVLENEEAHDLNDDDEQEVEDDGDLDAL